MKINLKIIILVFIIVIVSFLASCKKEEQRDFLGTPILRENSVSNITNSVSNDKATANTTIINSSFENNSTQLKEQVKNQTKEKSEENITAKPPVKSKARLTVRALHVINLNSSDFEYYAERVVPQTKYLSNQSLMLYDGFEWYLKEGHISTFNYDEDSNYNDPEITISSTVLRYETDYMNDFIKNKKFSLYNVKNFTPSVGEYAIGYYEFPTKGAYKSIYYYEFIKYDVYVKITLASKTLTVRKDEIQNYARKIERRIVK
jgi:hypothetical protein